MFTLRKYQEDAVKAGLDYFNSKSTKPSIIVAPVAAGKSLIIGSITSQLDAPTIVFQPSKELLEQNYAKLLSFGGEASIYSASMGQKEIGHTTYATIGSVVSKGKEFKKKGVKYVLVDECHLLNPDSSSMYMRFLKDLGAKKVLGLTATPIRLKAFGTMEHNYSQLCVQTRTKPKFFKDIIHVTQIQELIESNFWAKLKYIQYDFDESKLILNTTGAEFTEHSVSLAVAEQGVNNNIYKLLKKLKTERKKILVFMDSVATAEKMASLFPNEAACVSSKTPKKERAKIVEAFKNGDLKIVTNYAVLGIGFDAPEIDCIIYGVPTNSFVRYYQFVGRGTRISPSKKDCLVVDFGNNIKRFGTLDKVTIENFSNYGWGLFSGDKLLSGVPLDLSEPITKAKILQKENREKQDLKALEELAQNPVMTFGKHKDKKIEDIPTHYLMWVLKEVQPNTKEKEVLLEAIQGYLEFKTLNENK